MHLLSASVNLNILIIHILQLSNKLASYAAVGLVLIHLLNKTLLLLKHFLLTSNVLQLVVYHYLILSYFMALLVEFCLHGLYGQFSWKAKLVTLKELSGYVNPVLVDVAQQLFCQYHFILYFLLAFYKVWQINLNLCFNFF